MNNVLTIKILKMIKNSFILIVLIFSFTSCKFSKDESNISKNEVIKLSNLDKINNEKLLLLQQKCYACHSVTATSHDNIIAPPMVAIKRRYLISYKNKEEFVTAMTKWALDPKLENALMRGAVKQFNVMPKQPFNKDEIVKIAEYMYDNELEKPAWFEDHFNEEHPEGMGNGKGKGRKFKTN